MTIVACFKHSDRCGKRNTWFPSAKTVRLLSMLNRTNQISQSLYSNFFKMLTCWQNVKISTDCDMVECIPRYEEVCDPVPVLVHDWTRSKVLKLRFELNPTLKNWLWKENKTLCTDCFLCPTAWITVTYARG